MTRRCPARPTPSSSSAGWAEETAHKIISGPGRLRVRALKQFSGVVPPVVLGGPFYRRSSPIIRVMRATRRKGVMRYQPSVHPSMSRAAWTDSSAASSSASSRLSPS